MKRLKVLLFGYNGENNTGSESRLVTILEDMRQTVGKKFELDLQSVVIEEKNVRRYLPDADVEMVELGSSWPIGVKWIPRVLQLMLKRNNIMVLVEGSTFTDHFSSFLLYSFLFATLLCRIVKCKVVAYAVDCGDLKPLNQKITRWVTNKMDLIITRSFDAKEKLIKYGVTREIYVTTDTAFQYKPPSEDYIQNLLSRLSLGMSPQSTVHSPQKEVGSEKWEMGSKKWEVEKLRSYEDRNQKTEGREKSAICNLQSAICNHQLPITKSQANSNDQIPNYNYGHRITNNELRTENPPSPPFTKGGMKGGLIGIAPKEFFWWPVTIKLWGNKENLYRYPYYHTWKGDAKENSEKVKNEFAKFADYCIEKFNANILFFCMERMDYPPSRDIFERMKNKDFARLIPSNDYDLKDITGLLSRLKFLVSTRYHACVLSMCSSIPMIAVSHDVRCESLFKELDVHEFYIQHNTKNLYGMMLEKIDLLAGREIEIKDKIKKAFPSFLDRCLQNRKIFMDWFEENSNIKIQISK